MTQFVLNGQPVVVDDGGRSLLEVLRDDLDLRSPKDGCSPQGQCGCCTVWVEGAPRVACVTPASRMAGREITTVEGLADADDWAAAFAACGASQCGFCTPGIIMRLAAVPPERRSDDRAVGRVLRAHLCRCTGWQTIREACALVGSDEMLAARRDWATAAQRAELEGHTPQQVGPDVALGRGGFADDTAPAAALVAIRGPDGSWATAETAAAARAAAGIVQGRRTTAPPTWPVALPVGEWARTLQTTWVEPAPLEPDATWCAPDGTPAAVLANGGAFGAKLRDEVGEVAARLAAEHGRPVRVRLSREDVVRHGAKRPPLAVGLHADGSGVAVLARPGDKAEEEQLRTRIAAVAPEVEVGFVDVPGPPVGASLRAAGWAEVAAARSSLGAGPDHVVAPNGAVAAVEIGADGVVRVAVRAGRPLDEVVLRSYCIGAVHMALGMVRSEGIAVDADGLPLDLTIRSFGILRADETPPVEVTIEVDDRESLNVSDAVFAATLAAAWRAADFPPRIPCS